MKHQAIATAVFSARKSILLAFLVVFGSLISQFTILSYPAAAALDSVAQQECMNKLNGQRVSDPSPEYTLYKDKCATAAGGICVTEQGSITTSNRIDYYRCTPVSSESADAAARAKAAEVEPLQLEVCGNRPSDQGQLQYIWLPCAQAVASAYNSCGFATEGPLAGSPVSADAAAACMIPKIQSISGARNTTKAKLTTAIEAGRKEAQRIRDEAATNDATAGARAECEGAGGTWADGKCAEKEAVLCSGGPLGWIMCPLAELATSITEFFAGLINDMLTFSPLLTSTQGKAIQDVWRLIVNIANVLLVIAFLVVVFSQATSVGLSNYGIKKMLPKIIAAAILMNLSFFICAVAVDISNILGQSVAGIVQVGIDALPDPPASADLKPGADAGDMAFVALLGALGIGGLFIAPGLLYFALPILVSAAAAVFTAFLVIIFRQVALVILIIISPLAFVAWVLPNTESWFEKWRKFFIALLAMFPLIMGIFYGSTFLSHIMLLTLDSDKGAEANTVKLMALAVLVLPLFALPFVMKMAGGILERFGAWTNNRQKGLIDRSRNWAKDNSKRANESQRARMAKADWGKKWGRNEDGTEKTGGAARVARGLGAGAGVAARGTRFVGGYGDRRDRKHAEQERNAKRIQEEQWGEILSEVDPSTGKPTARAQNLAMRAAGAGGAEGAERIRQLATEQKLKEYNDEVGRRHKSLGLDNFFIHETEVYETDANGNNTGKALAMHERLAALAGGKTLSWKGQHGRVSVSGKDDYWKEAAMLQIGNTGDSKAISATLTGDEYEYEKNTDGSFKTDSKGERIVKIDQNGEKVKSTSNPYLLNADDKRTLIKYVQGNGSVRGAFPDLIKSAGGAFGQPNAGALIGYHVDEAVRNYDYAVQAKAAGNDRPMTVLREEFQKAMMSERWDTMPVDTRERFEQLLGVNALDIREKAGLPVPGGPKQSNNTGPTIQLTLTSPTFTGPAPAADVIRQVQTAGGWNNLQPEQVINIYNHANNLPPTVESTQLSSEALDELRKRNIFSPGQGTP